MLSSSTVFHIENNKKYKEDKTLKTIKVIELSKLKVSTLTYVFNIDNNK